MKYNIKKMISAATKNVYKNSSAFHQYNVARLGIKENTQIELPTFNKQGQQKHVEKQRNLRMVENLPQLRSLTDTQWGFIELVVSSRKERCCPICFGTFGAEPQVVTSCRHTMHEKCLSLYYKKYPNKLNKCIVCMKDCTAIVSQRLLNVSYTLCIIDIQTAIRSRKAFLQKQALKTIHGGVFDENVAKFNDELNKLQKNRQLRFEQEVQEYMKASDEADRLYEQFLRVNNSTVFDGVQLARKRHCTTCTICYETLLEYHYLQFDAESKETGTAIGPSAPNEGQQNGIIAMSCCGSLFHAGCLIAAEADGRYTCCYCKQSYIKLPVILYKYFG